MINYPEDLGPREPGRISEEEISAIRKTLLAKRVMIFIACVMLAVLLAAIAVGVLLIRSTQTSNKPTLTNAAHAAQQAKKGTDRIIECTTPGRDCYDRGQVRLAKTVQGLTVSNRKAAAAAASCAAQIPHPTFRSVYRCMVVSLADDSQR